MQWMEGPSKGEVDEGRDEDVLVSDAGMKEICQSRTKKGYGTLGI